MLGAIVILSAVFTLLGIIAGTALALAFIDKREHKYAIEEKDDNNT